MSIRQLKKNVYISFYCLMWTFLSGSVVDKH